MAQRTEKEETEFKVVPEPTITALCVKCGGVAASSATNSLCHNCLNATATTSTTSTATTSTTSTASSAAAKPLNRVKSFRSIASARSSQERKLDSNETSRDPSEEEVPSQPAKRAVNRCSGCRRKVGLTGFRCRCGELFCAEHRYSDRHECTYDYKSAGRDAIARENPVVKAAKIVKI